MEKKFENENQLLDFTNQLLNKKVCDVFTDEQINSTPGKNKGKLGHLIEKYFYGYDLNSDKRPDFDELGIELKVTPLNRLIKGGLSPKERLVLSMVSHDDLINNENIIDSDLWKKMEKLLLIWYVYSPDFRSNEFTLIKLLKMKETEYMVQISRDWEKIREMLLNGEADEFSESKTKFLGVTRKGAGGSESKIDQPFSNRKYYKRAFTLKTTYIRQLINEIIEEDKKIDYLSYMKEKLVGKKIIDLAEDKYLKYKDEGKNIPKNIASLSVMKTLGFSSPIKLTEYHFEKTSEYLTFKTIPLLHKKDGSYRIKEAFKINVPISDEANHLDWDDSLFSTIFDNSFVCVLYEFDERDILKSRIVDIVKFDFNDRNIDFVIDAYNEFRQRAKEGNLVNPDNGNVNFIKAADDKGVHFRPWATNKEDTFKTKAGEVGTKTGLWLNIKLIEGIIFGI